MRMRGGASHKNSPGDLKFGSRSFKPIIDFLSPGQMAGLLSGFLSDQMSPLPMQLRLQFSQNPRPDGKFRAMSVDPAALASAALCRVLDRGHGYMRPLLGHFLPHCDGNLSDLIE